MANNSSEFDEALQAWLAGDAEGCLLLCERLGDAEAAAPHAMLLRARALLRLRRSRDAIALLESPPRADATAGEAATAAMLLGTAYARSGDVERGLAILADASRSAAGADASVRSEIALGIGLAHYQRRDFARAEAALDEVGPDSDIVYARALEARGWIAKVRNDFPAAVAAFEASLEQLERCRQFDRFLEANLVTALGYIAVELLDFPRWAALQDRARRVRWDANGLEYYRFWFEMNRSMADEVEGRPREALHAARDAAAGAPSSAFRLFAECRRAAVLFSYGELLGFEDLAASIRAEFGAIDLRLLHAFEEINLAVVVAETLALIGDGAGAAAALRRLDTLSATQLALLHDEPMKRAYLAFVEGLVADANSDAFRAQHRYRDAFRAFTTIGMTRRALLAALRLGELNGDDEARAYVEERARTLPASSWIRARSARFGAWETDPLLGELTRAEREVLLLLNEGKSTAEIAAIRFRSPQTIRNTVSKLLQAFAVDNRQALIKECARRGAFLAGAPAAPQPDGEPTAPMR
jgi:DNA-binding CsgD family transcriptional regulator